MNSSHAHKARFWYLLGVIFKSSDDHPRHFYMGGLPGCRCGYLIDIFRITKIKMNRNISFLPQYFRDMTFIPVDSITQTERRRMIRC